MSEQPISVSPDALLKPGTVVDDFVIEELFSIGASSVVYRARQPSLDRTVALKLLPKERSSDQRWVTHFRRGAQLLAAITHPNIVPVYGSGRYHDREFLAMMFVPGGHALDRAFPAPQSEAGLAGLLTAGRDIAKALAFIHQQGFVHGDVKPSNILVGANGHAYLIDFDLANRPGEAIRIGPEGDRASRFLAPEALTASGTTMDHRSDIYSFGATLYSALAGNPPRTPLPIPLVDVRPDLSAGLCAVVHRCLEEDANKRYPDAAAVVEAVDELIEGMTTPGPGRNLGPFEIVAEIGRGGMGVVFRAIQQPLGREVALKVLPQEFGAMPSRVKRFQREAEAISRLDHPHIIPIYAFGKFGGYHYFAMKLVKGPTLAKLIESMKRTRDDAPPKDDEFTMQFASVADGTRSTLVDSAPTVPEPAKRPATPPPPPSAAADAGDPAYIERILGIFVKVAGALAHAHEHGILHRDIKPANIIIDEDGEPFVLDFGLARDETDLALTDSQAVCGTPYYMAPEQVQSDGSPTDRRTDVWGLGVTLFEVLALTQPFGGASRDQLFANIAVADIPPLREINKGVSRDLEGVVQKALRRSRIERYQDVAAFAEDIRAVLDGRPTSAKPTSSLHRIVANARRHRVPTGFALLVGLFLAAFSLVVGLKLAAGPGTGPADGSRFVADPSAVADELPRAAAVLAIVAENPADPASPMVEIVPAAYSSRENAVLVPSGVHAALPPGFDAAKHGFLVWATTNPVVPMDLDDPNVYRVGAGSAQQLSRLARTLPHAVKSLPQMAGFGRLGRADSADGAITAYRFDGSTRVMRCAESQRVERWTSGATIAARCLTLHVDRTRMDRLGLEPGSLAVPTDGKTPSASFATDAMRNGGVVVGLGGEILGYLVRGGRFIDLGWLGE